MRSEEEINKMISEMQNKVWHIKTQPREQQRCIHWVHALRWVLQDEKEVMKERLREIDGKDGRSDRKEAQSE